MPFDPLDYVPANRFATNAELAELTQIYQDTGIPPTAEEAASIVGLPVTIASTTHPLPDGFAGKDWDNPDWGRKIRQLADRNRANLIT